ncbi:MAG: ABC transporter ATP-binding protein [Angelakisella sp.]
MTNNILELKQVKKAYENFTLGEISLELPRGVVMGLVGANGAGKTTIIKLLLGLIKPDSGEISILGGTPSDSTLHEKIGVVFDELPVSDILTAKQLGSIMSGLYKGWDAEGYSSLPTRLELPAYKPANESSRGMKKKLSIAMALSHGAELLLLDEPTGGLDPIVRQEILDLFRDFMQDESHSILISSHITSDLERITDYISYIDKGNILLIEEKDVLLERYSIVRGNKELLKEIDQSGFIGLQEESFGFEALVKDCGAVTEKYSQLVADRAHLDDIMTFIVREARR